MCEDNTYRHDCFDEYKYSTIKKIGYYKNNNLWDGLEYQNNILIIEYINGKLIYKSFCNKSDNGWSNCPSGNRYKPIENGYFDQNNNRQGKFLYEYKSGNVYIGEYKDSKKHGQGTFTWENGTRYIGEFKNGNIHGQGTKTYTNGIIEKGIWENNKSMYTKKPTSTLNAKIEEYKSFCSEIGFTPGTEKFGECVVEAIKKG